MKLGFFGFIPFPFLILLSVTDKNNFDIYIKFTLFYLFLIISFIGASYWGIAIYLKKKTLAMPFFSVIPSILVSILYLLNIDLVFKLLLGIVTLNIVFLYEAMNFKKVLPNWYLFLRGILNLFVTISILVIILIFFIYKGVFL